MMTQNEMVFKMMMVKRDHNQRYNPFDYLFDRYQAVLGKLDGYTYEASEIEKTLKALEGVRLTLSNLAQIEELEQRIAVLPKPDDFESRAAPVKASVPPIKAVRL